MESTREGCRDCLTFNLARDSIVPNIKWSTFDWQFDREWSQWISRSNSRDANKHQSAIISLLAARCSLFIMKFSVCFYFYIFLVSSIFILHRTEVENEIEFVYCWSVWTSNQINPGTTRHSTIHRNYLAPNDTQKSQCFSRLSIHSSKTNYAMTKIKKYKIARHQNCSNGMFKHSEKHDVMPKNTEKEIIDAVGWAREWESRARSRARCHSIARQTAKSWFATYEKQLKATQLVRLQHMYVRYTLKVKSRDCSCKSFWLRERHLKIGYQKPFYMINLIALTHVWQ